MKAKKIIVHIIALALMGLILVLGLIEGVGWRVYDGALLYVMAAIMVVSGLIGGYLVHNLLHECGHALFARLSGARVMEVAFWGLVFAKGRVSFSARSTYAGWTAFVPKRPQDAAKGLTLSLAGGAIGSMVSLIVIFAVTLIFNLFEDFHGLLIMSGAMGSIVYMICVNFLSGADGTDGRLLMGRPGERSLFWTKVVLLECQSHMLNGKSLKEIEKPFFDVSLLKRYVTVCDVMLGLSLGDIGLAERLIDAYLKQPVFDDNEHIALLLCKMLTAISKDDGAGVDALYNRTGWAILSDIDDPLVLLCSYAYKKYTGDFQWADAVKKTLLRSVYGYPLTGYGKTVMEIYTALYGQDSPENGHTGAK